MRSLGGKHWWRRTWENMRNLTLQLLKLGCLKTTKKSNIYCFSPWVGSNPLFFSWGSGIQLTLVWVRVPDMPAISSLGRLLLCEHGFFAQALSHGLMPNEPWRKEKELVLMAVMLTQNSMPQTEMQQVMLENGRLRWAFKMAKHKAFVLGGHFIPRVVYRRRKTTGASNCDDWTLRDSKEWSDMVRSFDLFRKTRHVCRSDFDQIGLACRRGGKVGTLGPWSTHIAELFQQFFFDFFMLQ